MFKFIMASIRQILLKKPVKPMSTNNITPPTSKPKFVMFVDLDNVMGDEDGVGTVMRSRLDDYLSYIQQDHFPEFDVSFRLYGNLTFLKCEAIANENVTMIDTPVRTYNHKTEADPMIMVDMLRLKDNVSNAGLFTNDCDFAYILNELQLMGKTTHLVTNRISNKHLRHSASHHYDGQLQLLSIKCRVEDIIKRDFDPILKRVGCLHYYLSRGYCKRFKGSDWQGYGSFDQLLASSLGTAFTRDEQQQLYPITEPTPPEHLQSNPALSHHEYDVVFSSLCTVASHQKLTVMRDTLRNKCHQHDVQISADIAAHFVSKLLPFIGKVKQSQKLATHYWQWVKSSEKIKSSAHAITVSQQ